jgi:uncharacterized membrane protein YkgB
MNDQEWHRKERIYIGLSALGIILMAVGILLFWVSFFASLGLAVLGTILSIFSVVKECSIGFYPPSSGWGKNS